MNVLLSLSFFRYEDAFNKFVDEINALAAYQWWEGSVFSILCILSFPLAWSWQQWRRRKKLQKLREFVRSEYDHSCLRSCRSRALYEGLKVCIFCFLLYLQLFFDISVSWLDYLGQSRYVVSMNMQGKCMWLIITCNFCSIGKHRLRYSCNCLQVNCLVIYRIDGF